VTPGEERRIFGVLELVRMDLEDAVALAATGAAPEAIAHEIEEASRRLALLQNYLQEVVIKKKP
jgi:citrate lyase beta subunit